jgi:signal transduction histidine kinase
MVVEFTALNLASPENVAFRYKLEGLDQEWVDAGAVRFAPYTRVPPGEYRFRVTACGRDGIWNEVGSSLALSVQPYLWELAWVRLVVGLFVAGLSGGGVVLAVRRRYRRKIERLEQRQALERERTRIAQDLHDDLGSGLVEINLGSELAQDPALGVGEVREHTREIGARAREMVTALDEIVWAVNPIHDTVNSLATYFCQYAQHFLEPTPMRCHLDVARDLPVAPFNAEQRHSLFLAFKEALSNAVQHSGAVDLRLRIAVLDGALTVAVSDNGRGLDQTQVLGQVGADGLGNMRRRLQQLGGRCEVTSRTGEGTTVTFTVPLTG